MAERESVLDQGGPRREWLVRCTDKTHDLGVCSVEANDGQVELISPHGDVTTLGGPEIIDLRDGLDAAIRQAEADIQDRTERRA